MKIHGILTAVLACAVLAPAAAEAQVQVRVTQRGALGIMTESTRTNGVESAHRVIVDVVPGSPAERAGVAKGDTIISVNGRPADQLMRTAFEPGDTVRLRVRRDNREHDIAVIAGERTGRFETFTFEMLPDSVMKQVAVIMRNVATELDTLNLRYRLRVERVPGDSVMMLRFGDDSTTFRYRRAHPDSLPFRFPNMNLDSLRIHFQNLAEQSGFLADSAHVNLLRAAEGRRIFSFDDSIRVMGPGEIFAANMTMGLRAVAGAELSELNPGLADYFGATDGVLVLNARDGTPAARAGLLPGDVIRRVNGVEVSSIHELRRAIDRAEPGSTLRLGVLRRGQVEELNLARE